MNRNQALEKHTSSSANVAAKGVSFWKANEGEKQRKERNQKKLTGKHLQKGWPCGRDSAGRNGRVQEGLITHSIANRLRVQEGSWKKHVRGGGHRKDQRPLTI